MAKSKQRFAWTYDHAESTVKVVDSASDTDYTFEYSELPEEIADRVAVYGLGKVLQDRNSQVDADGKIAGMVKTYESLVSGQWKAERSVGARFLPAVIEAIATVKGCSVAAAQAAYRALDDAQRVVLKENLAEEIAKVEAKRAAAEDVDLDDLI